MATLQLYQGKCVYFGAGIWNPAAKQVPWCVLQLLQPRRGPWLLSVQSPLPVEDAFAVKHW